MQDGPDVQNRNGRQTDIAIIGGGVGGCEGGGGSAGFP